MTNNMDNTENEKTLFFNDIGILIGKITGHFNFVIASTQGWTGE